MSQPEKTLKELYQELSFPQKWKLRHNFNFLFGARRSSFYEKIKGEATLSRAEETFLRDQIEQLKTPLQKYAISNK